MADGDISRDVALAARERWLALWFCPTPGWAAAESHCVYLLDPGCPAARELQYAADTIVLGTLGEFRVHGIWRQDLHICG